MAAANGKYADGMGDAVISPCGRYRYRLSRHWLGGSGRVCFIMLNPSTADATKDDPTIRRCIGFARDWGYSGLDVVNKWAFRTPSPLALARELHAQSSNIMVRGPENDDHIHTVASASDLIVVAWGACQYPLNRAAAIRKIIGPLGKPVKCFGLTDKGQPRHPLYLPKARELIDYPMPEAVTT